MKKITLLFFVLILTGFSAKVFSQSATTMTDIISTVSTKISDLEEKQNQEVVNVTMDLLINNSEKIMRRFLDPSFKYDIVLLGDRRISKLRIKIYRKGTSDWEFIDSLSSAKPQLRIEPEQYGEYMFNVSVSEFQPGDNTGHFALLLYHKNPERDK